MTESITWVRKPAPFADETLAGFLGRFAQENFIASRPALLHQLGISPAIRLEPSELRKLSSALGVPEGQLQKMAPSEAPSVPALRKSLTRTSGEPVCPECLREASYSRRLWSHSFATACPKHSVQLIENCSACGAGLRHSRPHAHLCACGQDLRSMSAQPAAAYEIELACLLDGHVPPELTLPLDLTCGIPADVDLFLFGLINYFGVDDARTRAAKAGKAAAPRSAAAARECFSALAEIVADWPSSFSGTVAGLVRVPPRQASAGIAPRLGTWYRFLFLRFRDPAYDRIRTAAANSIVQVHEGPIDVRVRYLHTFATTKREWLPLKEAARELGVRAERLAAGVDDGRIEASVHDEEARYRQRFLTRDEVERLRAVRADHCAESEAAEILGVSHSVLSILKEAGLVQLRDAATLPPVTRGRVRRSELDALAQRLQNGICALEGARADLVALRDLNLRRTTDRRRLVSLCRSIADGSLRAAAHDGSGQLGGLLFAKKEVQSRIASFALGAQLHLTQICHLTGVHWDAVKTWVDTGVLTATRASNEQGHPMMVSLEEFVRFLLEFSPLSCLASQMGSSSRGVAEVLTRRCVPLIGQSEKRGTLVRIRDMVSLASGITPRAA